MSSLPKLKKRGGFDAETFKAVNPVVSVTRFNNGVFRVNRESKLQGCYNANNGRKGRKIKMLTTKSLSLLTATIQATEVELNTMLTLTYPKVYPRNGEEVKRALNTLLQRLRSKGKFEYLWFLEFQKRGAPHFHILTDHGGITPRMRVDVAETWVRHMTKSDWFIAQTVIESIDNCTCEYDTMVTHIRRAYGVAFHRDTWQIVREKDGAKRYVTKYAQKPEQKVVPKEYQDVGRFWGCSTGVKLQGGAEVETTEENFVDFLLEQEHPTAQFDVIPTYLWGVNRV